MGRARLAGRSRGECTSSESKNGQSASAGANLHNGQAMLFRQRRRELADRMVCGRVLGSSCPWSCRVAWYGFCRCRAGRKTGCPSWSPAGTRQAGPLPHELDDISVEQFERRSRQDDLVSLHGAELMDLDPGRLPGVRMPRPFERRDLTPVRLGLEHRLFQMLEELPRDPRPVRIADGGNLELHAGYTLEVADWRQQHHKLTPTLSKEPEAVFQAPDRLLITDVDLLVLRRHRHRGVVFAGDQAPGQVDSLMRLFLPHTAEMGDVGAGAKQAIDRPLKVGSNPERESPLGDCDFAQRSRVKMRLNQTRY